MVERVGIVGMGLMGQAFIANMRKSQIAVQGFDLDPARMDQLTAQGGATGRLAGCDGKWRRLCRNFAA